MSDLLSVDEELRLLRAENERLRRQQDMGSMVRVVLPESRAILPTRTELKGLFDAVLTHWPRDFATVEPDMFARAFHVLTTFHRTPEPDSSRYAWHWVAAANDRLGGRGEVSLLALTAAVLAWGDIALTRWDLRSEGYLLEFGLSEFHGRLPRDEWRSTLAGKFVKPIDKRPKKRVGDDRTPRPSILVDGKKLPDDQRFFDCSEVLG